jgi:urea transport system permease protein
MADITALLLDTLSFTLTLLLVTLGLVVIFGMMNVINMAHGEFFLIGAYVVVFVTGAGGSFWLGLLLAPIVLAILGFGLEWLVIRHIYHRFIDTILATWGIDYPIYRLFIMAMSLALAAGTYLVLFRTPVGLMARGVIANRAMAASLGINTRRMDWATFAFGAALAGFAGAVMSPIMSVDPQMGVGFLVPSFLAVLVGGVNSLLGAVLGSAVIGGSTTGFSAYISQADAQIFVFILAMFLIRLFPDGLTGRKR